MPTNVVSKTGEAVELRCSTDSNIIPVDWLFTSTDATKPQRIFSSGGIVSAFRSRFDVRKNITGEYTLVFHVVQLSDSGTYTCVDQSGEGPDRASAELIVLG